MNTDPSNNPIRQLQTEYNERFNLIQYYNAVEDEQYYMNEYTYNIIVSKTILA